MTLKERKLWEDLINLYKYPVVPGNRVRGNGHKMKRGRFHPNIRKHSLSLLRVKLDI